MSTKGLEKVLFFPSEESEYELLKVIQLAKKKLRICIFTFTNNNISNLLYIKHKHGVDVKVIADDQQAETMGSDIQDLANAGIPIRLDNDLKSHMHHKFCLIDDRIIVNGSFNWTRAAVCTNQENLIIQEHKSFVKQFDVQFDKLWNQYKGNVVKKTGPCKNGFLKALEMYKQNGGQINHKNNLKLQKEIEEKKEEAIRQKLLAKQRAKEKKAAERERKKKLAQAAREKKIKERERIRKQKQAEREKKKTQKQAERERIKKQRAAEKLKRSKKIKKK